MSLDVELGGFDNGAQDDSSDLNTTREKFEQYLSAGILFPDEIRNAERILRHLKKLAVSQIVSTPASEKIPV
jgi:hypothetical protein